MPKRVLTISLIVVIAVFAFTATKAAAQQVPQPELVDICKLDGVGGNLEPGDNPDVLPSVFTLICTDPRPGNNLGVVITKFLINWLPNNTAPFSDIIDLQIRFFNDVTGEKKWEGKVEDPKGLKDWPIPSARFVGTGPFVGRPFDKEVVIPDGGTLRIEIRPSIPNTVTPIGEIIKPGFNNILDTTPSGDDVIVNGVIKPGPDGVLNSTPAGDDVIAPFGGDFGVSIMLEGSEGDTTGDTGGAKKEFHGFKTKWYNDPIKEEIEVEFKQVYLKVEPIEIPSSNLNPSDTKTIHKFRVDLLIEDKVTEPELNNTPLTITTPSITFTLHGTGTFSPGCVDTVDIVDQQTNQSLIGGPKSAGSWGASVRLSFPATNPGILIPPFIPDDGKYHRSFSAEVQVHLPYPMPPGCGTVQPGEPLQGRTPQNITIDADVIVDVMFNASEMDKNKKVVQTVSKSGTAHDGIVDLIFDRSLEKILVGQWTFETLDQKEVEKIGPSTIAKLGIKLTDEDSSNQDAVKIEGIDVRDNSDPRQACPDPGIVAIQIQDANGNVLGTAPGFSKIKLQNPDGSAVIIPDGDMDQPSQLELTVKLIVRDKPEPKLPPGCKLMVKFILQTVEGIYKHEPKTVPPPPAPPVVTQPGFEGKYYEIPVDAPHIQVPWQTITVDIKSLSVKAGQVGDVEITVDTQFLGKMEATVIFDHPSLDVNKLFDVTGVVGVGPYKVTTFGITNADIDGDGILETVVTFTIELAPGQMPAAGTVVKISGKAAGADVKDVLTKLGVDMTITVDFRAKPVLFDIVVQPIPPAVIRTDPGTVLDPEESLALLY